ncbi:MAG: iron ABC transporter [Chloroflexi bacterium]|nr:iron ABC transporter [Chloroflexota bacterium]
MLNSPIASSLLLFVILITAIILGVAIGSVPIPPRIIMDLILNRMSITNITIEEISKYSTILFDIRMPRVALMALTGAALATAGATYQGLFRNPLADPYLVGVASGAGLGATIAITTNLNSDPLGISIITIAAFAGGIITVGIVVMTARVSKTTPVTTMLLAGIAIGSFATASTTLLMLRRPDGLQRAFNWMLGAYLGGGWDPVKIMIPYMVLGSLFIFINARALNVFQLGEEQAQQLGINVERLKIILIAAATLMTASAVAFGGLIGFVGLIVPHALRILTGPDYRRLLPCCLLGGASFLILSDLAARNIMAPQELPVGIITALTGTPFFIFLLRKLKRSVF